jgi:hypothetical protein
MSAAHAQEEYPFEKQWEDGELISICLGGRWCPATVVRTKGLRVVYRLEKEFHRITGYTRVWFFWKREEYLIYPKGYVGEIIPRPFSNITARVAA